MAPHSRTLPRIAALAGALGLCGLLPGCAGEAPRAPPPPSPPAAGASAPALPAPGAPAAPAALAPPAPETAAPLPALELLLGLLKKQSPAELMEELETLLLAGESGHERLEAFLAAAEREQKQDLLFLLHDPAHVYGLLRLVALHPDPLARLARHLMKATVDRPRALVRREMYRFLPVFLDHHAGRYPELRAALEEDITLQLRAGGFYLFEILGALEALRFDPPVDAMLAVLGNPETSESHRMAIAHLARRGEAGVQALVGYLREVKDLNRSRIVETFQELAQVELDQDRGIVRGYFADERPPIRRAALLGYFTFARGADSIPYLLDYLNSDVQVSLKQSLIIFLRQKNLHLLVEMARLTEDIHDERVRAILQRVVTPRTKEAGAAAAPREQTTER